MKPTANQQVLHHRGNYLVRRQRLAPGEATPWHRDPFHRVTVVLSGDLLNIEFRDGGETQPWRITVGEVDWVEPSDRVHRAVNVGKEVFEEVVTFFLDRPDAEPQPEDDSLEHVSKMVCIRARLQPCRFEPHRVGASAPERRRLSQQNRFF
jgi:quercetin dioxygenase-like cupin family protein